MEQDLFHVPIIMYYDTPTGVFPLNL